MRIMQPLLRLVVVVAGDGAGVGGVVQPNLLLLLLTPPQLRAGLQMQLRRHEERGQGVAEVGGLLEVAGQLPLLLLLLLSLTFRIRRLSRKRDR